MGVTAVTLALGYAFVCAFIYLEPTLPTVAAMKNNELAVPLRVYTSSGELISQIGQERRIPVKYEQIPDVVKNAFIAAEDDQFFDHHGFDWKGIVRALFVNVTSGERQGASTITMQAARSAFFTQEQTVRRKLQEIFVTQRLESQFTKQEILALYLNVIFFGNRSYGVAAAAETYFGKPLGDLTLGEAAMLARVPQWPSRYNPFNDPEGSTGRRAYVLRRMLELGFIDQAAVDVASKEVVRASGSCAQRTLADVDAAYVAEMVRLHIEEKFGASAIEAGYKVYTTLDGRLQKAANHALRMGLVDYTRRHGWRGATSKVELSGTEANTSLDPLLDEFNNVGILRPAIVLAVGEKDAKIFVKGRGNADIAWAGLSWARRPANDLALGPEPKTAGEIIARGDVVYVVYEKPGAPAELAQIPEAESALIALDPNDGAILSLVGGFDYFEGQGKFNRVTQAKRQPGSGFKPFMYAAAMAGDFTPATMILDAPIIMDDPNLEEVWRPKNSGGGFRGPMRLREAIVQSRNLVSIRLLQQLGIKAAIEYVQNFGFTKQQLPNNLTLALGSMGATPLEIASGFAVFANGGYRIEPYFIERIEGPGGQILYTAEPKTVCAECTQPIRAVSAEERARNPSVSATIVPPSPLPVGARRTLPADQAISPQVAFLMNDIMKDVITRGTGRRALALGRTDLRGKTGTTNENVDTWFNGFNASIVASVWVGMDVPQSLGDSEEGARTAVPIWVDYMREALRNVPQKQRSIPEGVIELKVNGRTGGTRDADLDPVFEFFRADKLPTEEGYIGDPGVGPQDIDPNSPDTPQSGADPIF